VTSVKKAIMGFLIVKIVNVMNEAQPAKLVTKMEDVLVHPIFVEINAMLVVLDFLVFLTQKHVLVMLMELESTQIVIIRQDNVNVWKATLE